MDEVTELAENHAATEAEETTVEETEDTAAPQEADVESPVAEAPEDQAEAENAESDSGGEEEVAAEETSNMPTRDADGFSSSLPSLEGEGGPRKHIAGGIGYEIIFVVRSGDQALVDESSQRVQSLIEEQCEGAVDNVRASEVRRFAYPINKQTEGVYVVVNARFRPEHTSELDRYFKLDENVLRHMMLKEER